MLVDMRAIEELFTENPNGQPIKNAGVSGYRTKTTKAGKQLDVDCYPIFDNRAARRKLQSAKHQEAQQRVDQRNRWLKLKRLMDANFTEDDVEITLTYKGENVSREESGKMLRNYLRKVNRMRDKLGLDKLKYIAVTECADGDGNEVRLHHHLVMSGGIDRDTLEGMWVHGMSQTRRLKPDDNGFEGFAKYLCKGAVKHKMVRQPQVTRWKTFTCSRNLKKPLVSIADKKLSRRRVEKIAAELPGAAKEVFEKLYKGYRFLTVDVRMSDQFPGAYIYVRMVRD